MNTPQETTVNLFETGLYTISDVAFLTKASSQRISRWVKGYSYDSGRGRKHQYPLWEPEIPPLMDTITLTFNDLVEILLVNEFRQEGVTLPKIRSTINALRKETNSKYPFSNKMIFTDGKELFEKLQDEEGRPLFLHISSKHKSYLFFSVTLPYLRKGMVFDEKGLVRRWYPNREKFGSVVVDPTISFGRPVIDGTRLNTSVVASAASAGHSEEQVANWFGIETDFVRQAISFHKQHKAA